MVVVVVAVLTGRARRAWRARARRSGRGRGRVAGTACTVETTLSPVGGEIM